MNDSWTRVTNPEQIVMLTDDLEFCLTVNVVTKSGTNYYDENFPLTREDLEETTDVATDLVALIGEKGTAQIGNAFIDMTQVESMEVIIYFRPKQ